jgi:hypothetical protein
VEPGGLGGGDVGLGGMGSTSWWRVVWPWDCLEGVRPRLVGRVVILASWVDCDRGRGGRLDKLCQRTADVAGITACLQTSPEGVGAPITPN